MINYAFQIIELDAEAMQAPQQAGEEREDYDARLIAATGKHYFDVITVSDDGKKVMAASPYFDGSDDEKRFAMLREAMTNIGNAIVAREQGRTMFKIDDPALEKDFRVMRMRAKENEERKRLG